MTTRDRRIMRLDDCSTQRNLSDEGRRHARAVGAALRKHKVPVDHVLTSPWCRCIETARLVFGDSGEVSRTLDNLFGRHENEARQVAALRALAVEWRGKGNLFLVSHARHLPQKTRPHEDLVVPAEEDELEQRQADGRVPPSRGLSAGGAVAVPPAETKRNLVMPDRRDSGAVNNREQHDLRRRRIAPAQRTRHCSTEALTRRIRDDPPVDEFAHDERHVSRAGPRQATDASPRDAASEASAGVVSS